MNTFDFQDLKSKFKIKYWNFEKKLHFTLPLYCLLNLLNISSIVMIQMLYYLGRLLLCRCIWKLILIYTCILHIVESYKFYYDDYSLAILLKGVCLKWLICMYVTHCRVVQVLLRWLQPGDIAEGGVSKWLIYMYITHCRVVQVLLRWLQPGDIAEGGVSKWLIYMYFLL